MTYSHPEIKGFKGLYIQANSFDVPDGALEVADNVTIAQDGTITKRRGFAQFGSSSADNNIFLFQNVLQPLYSNKISWLDSNGAETVNPLYSGVTVSETGGRIGRAVQANSNEYFTSDNGVLKLETYDGTVYSAGTPPALDLRAYLYATAANGPIGDGSTTGVVGDTQVGWRITFGKTDGNGNLLESAPSDIAVLTVAPFTNVDFGWNGTTVTAVTSVSVPHGLVSGMTVTVSDVATSTINGTYVITVINPFAFTYPNTTPAGSGPGTVVTSYEAKLEASVPSEIQDTSYVYSIYRSSQSLSATASPALDFKLIKQAHLTTAQLSSRIVFFTDTISDIFQASAEELYTNPNSQEGELQAASRPPLCQDVAFYKNHTFYANCTSRHSLEMALISTDPAYINAGSFIELKLGAVTRRYVFVSGVGNSTVTGTASGTTTVTVTYAAHGFSNGYTIYVSNVNGSVPEGTYTVSGVTTNTFQITSTGNTASSLDFEGITDGTNGIIQLVPPGSSPATALDATARGIVRAVNRDASSLVYSRYLSAPTDIPGKFYFAAKGFGSAFSVRADSDATGQAFSPTLPSSFSSGAQVTSSNDVLPNTIYTSKIGEPESVPLVNTLPIGSKSKAILRVVALRDCCIVIKEDGIYRIDGDQVTNFVSTILDSTVICLVPSSVYLIDNTVMMLSNQGVVKVSSSSVQIVSYKIELVFRAILGNPNLLSQTVGVAYESERLYMLTTLEPNTNVASTVYCYNTLSDCWTTWGETFKAGIVGPSDTLYLISEANVLMKERKNQNKLDYTGQDYPATVISVTGDGLAALINLGAVTPQPGDILVLNDVISRIKYVTIAGPDFIVGFYRKTNLAAGSATLYSRYDSTVKFAPYHGGAVNRGKQFSQFQVHLRDAGVSALDIVFANDSFGSSELTTWDASDVSSGDGWGFSPWGLFPWGLDDGINLTYTTQPGPIVRTYVPRFAQRCTFIQAVLTHSVAGERLGIQEIGYTVRGYGERVSK